ncbi:hypothetical protein CCR75_006235 [Bremia lactucae]|uniref:Uncharacterized protein n=1 Tax=Bremia lactucae TaxID=4779 RepID=A0A976ILV5_BRELC|nr:hypothetical protein CCR75_006235 [Bremia lactucae]
MYYPFQRSSSSTSTIECQEQHAQNQVQDRTTRYLRSVALLGFALALLDNRIVAENDQSVAGLEPMR